MRRNQFVLRLTDEQRNELGKWAASRTLPAEDVFRARLVLALAEGQTYSQIMRSLQTSAPTISRWKQRFEQQGLDGLDPRHKGSQPRVADAQGQARIARKTQQKPADGSTHWSCRKMAQALGLSKSTVQRVWAQARLKPHRLDRYMASNDPRFEEKAADIIGLYMQPPQHAAVFCVDEKTAIQALDRLDPVLPLSPGRAERHGFEYYRHGTLSLYAALDVKTGAVHGMTAARHTAQEFITFLKGLIERARWAQEIHVVLDNLSAHKTKDVQRFLAEQIQRDVIARSVFNSVADLGNKLRKYIRAYCKSAKPFRWTYTDPTRRFRPNKITGTAY
ncbi:MAG: IS630 family transposase [Bryobacteraceae bacterium]